MKDKEPFITTDDFNAHLYLCRSHNCSDIGILSALDKNDNIGLLTQLKLQTMRNPVTGVYSTIDLAFLSVAIINQLNIS